MPSYRLYDIAKVLRSKNSGPFEITLDVLFENPVYYQRIKESGVISRELIARLYHIDPSRISHLVFYDPAMGFKVTFARTVSSGTCYDTDVYGAQQHAPLAELRVEL